jgi:hypothetical protein
MFRDIFCIGSCLCVPTDRFAEGNHERADTATWARSKRRKRRPKQTQGSSSRMGVFVAAFQRRSKRDGMEDKSPGEEC